MAGIYIHIPFCKQACNYCNFHFTTSLRHKNELVAAILGEIELAPYEIATVNTIYFGGGTPSLCTVQELENILQKIYNKYPVVQDAEITLETNPDDISSENLLAWKKIGINRLSIGVQSFYEDDLRWMNRIHTAHQAIECIEKVQTCFTNFSIDLIYGLPITTTQKWALNLQKALSLGIPHLSCYALTVENNTPLYKQINQFKKADINPQSQSDQFLQTMQTLEAAGYRHYEISNFALPGYISQHNSAYWSGETYYGYGPAAHSYTAHTRWWSIANNAKYIQAIGENKLPITQEHLTPTQIHNEYVMIALRTDAGINIETLSTSQKESLLKKSEKYIQLKQLIYTQTHLQLTHLGKLFADGIAADLFI